MAANDMLKPAEAALVAHVDLRDVHRIFDEHILPDDLLSAEDGRQVAAPACSLISFYFESADALTSEKRRHVIAAAAARLAPLRARAFGMLAREDWTMREAFLTVDLAPFFLRAAQRMDRLDAARNMVVSDPEILGGMLVIRGTRVPVYDVAASLREGYSAASLLEHYPSLNAGQIELADVYAAANPSRGRPTGRRPLPKGAVLISEHRVPFRRPAG